MSDSDNMNLLSAEPTDVVSLKEDPTEGSQSGEPCLRTVLVLVLLYEPDSKYLEELLSSIASQTHRRFSCVLAWDGEASWSSEWFDSLLAEDSRFKLIERRPRLGTYQHVERLLFEFHQDFEFVVVADQDDVWEPIHLDRLVRSLEISGRTLVSANAWIVDRNLQGHRDNTLFRALSISQVSLPWTILVNSATGAGSLFRSELCKRALPFPKNFGQAVHDHWIFQVASVMGGCELLDAPSWHYRQHETNQIGIGSEGRLARHYRGFRKILSIVFGSVENDMYWKQIIENHSELLGRKFGDAPQTMIISKESKRNVSIWKLLNPRTVIATRGETIRLIRRG